MTQTKPNPSKASPSPATRRFGYSVAVLINAAMLVAVNNLLAWDILSFLTDDFERVIPIITVSLGASIFVNLVYLFYDPGWFKSLSQIGLLGISMAATVRIYQVFPFDFSAFEFNWTTATRVVLILAMVGVGIGVVAELVKLGARTSNS
ncbi:MAG: hypothetical protein OEM81_05340 [Acidimicrobiia bacterium]|nr:hypothetical protein [Acidimicrobiia bacterium]MDH3397242.1 hypothetical protein [Acidimicrobiia bacterium]